MSGDSANDDKAPALPRTNQMGLYAIAGGAILCAVGHGLAPAAFDDKTAMFLAVAIVALVIQQISKFKGFGVEFEKAVGRLQADVRNVKTAVNVMEKEVGPGRKNSVIGRPDLVALAEKAHDEIDPDDPNKGQFGGSPENNGYKLSARIEPLAGKSSAACAVHFQVVSTRSDRPLTGKVDVFLHPTFGRWAKYDLDVLRGVAADTITSYGAFTIGVVIRQDQTRLELDLMSVPGGTKSFYAN
jgi:hypothetical protein